ncbi:MAG: sulfite exporter TauE/SafE family protein, partial [Flammeovirgaceae bacterium]|nr:sulfite exporter TauE/SafE family protein [Flammeovirgaceae bacterium]MDW8287255.1 sulfite exporter TauE/SafE family protein [Flammeovirgaceae bacterium]
MTYFVIAFVAFLASGLTFFSGFGLGTILMPTFAFFFPVDIAIALTAIVHFLNNVFKFFLVRRWVEQTVLVRFGIFAILGAWLGAQLLTIVTQYSSIATWAIGQNTFQLTWLKCLIGSLMLVFTFLEMSPRWKNYSFSADKLPYGGFLSGFFGGLSGHQGALRSMFLLKCGLSKEHFVATGVAIACLIDIIRLTVYTPEMFSYFAAHR